MSISTWIVNRIKWFCNRAPEWIVAFTAIVAVIIALHQLQTAQQDTTEQLKLTQSTLSLAKRSADVSQRAWVLVTGVAYKEMVAEKPLHLTLAIKNVGASPAIDLRVIANCRATTEPVPDDLEVIQPTQPPSQAVLGPGEKTTSPILTDPIPTQLFTRIQNEAGSLLVYGQITYRDPLAPDRRTTFRAIYNPKTKSFQYAASGNTIE